MIITVTFNPSIDCSVTVERLRPGDVNRAVSSQTEAGGKGVNVSKLLGILGCENIATGLAGKDNFDEYARLLSIAGVKHDFLTVPGSTRRNIKISDADGVTTDINGAGLTVTEGDTERLKNLLDRYISKGDTVVISGSLGGGTSPAVIGVIIGHCKSLGAVTVVDTSGKALRHACDAKPYAVKPNLSELTELCGEDLCSLSDITSAALMLVGSGINTVVVSLGEKGLLYVTKNSIFLSPGLSVNVKCTVGAGDAVTAALAYGISRGMEDIEILRFASASGSAAVTMPGSTMPDRDTIESMLKKVNTEKYNRAD
jgi:1-phosphofructokinase